MLILSTPACLLLLIANIAISIAAFNSPRLIDMLLLHVRPLLQGRELYRIVTSGFIHADPVHLLLNAMTLFFLGPYLERMIGTPMFVVFYFLSLVAGSGWAVMENLRNPDYRALGASGAISGVTTAFAMFAPFVMLFVFFVPMPAILFAVGYVAFSAFASGRLQDGIGHAAHLGGALMGIVLVCLLYPSQVQDTWYQILARFGMR
jgi:membrane associated rhomboid family serine protease